MNERSDLGWWLNSVDFPSHGFSSVNFSGGLFSGTIAADPNVWLLETNFPNLPPIGKNGAAFPINANLYRIVADADARPGRRPVHAVLLDHEHDVRPAGPADLERRHDDAGLAHLFRRPGDARAHERAPSPGTAPSGRCGSIPRRTTRRPAVRSISTGCGSSTTSPPLQEHHLERLGAGRHLTSTTINARPRPNRTLGARRARMSAARSYSLNVGALAPGNYYVDDSPAGTSGNFAYSSGFYQVNAPATITVTSPPTRGARTISRRCTSTTPGT